MIRYLFDPANAITATGIVFSTLALYSALSGHLEAAVALGLWAMLADQLDGVVAVRTPHRRQELSDFGKSIDGFADLIYGAVLPVVIIISLSEYALISLLTGVLLLVCGAIRLSYFSNNGLSPDRCFLGVPLSYDMPILAVLMLIQPWIGVAAFPWVVNVIFILVAVLHVISIRVPAPNSIAYASITVFVVFASAGLGVRAI